MRSVDRDSGLIRGLGTGNGCLLIVEPSCERRNELLDRALVVDTVADAGAAFFAEPGA